MPAHKIADISIKVGEYESNGEKKSRNRAIGKLMRSDDGRQFIILNAEVLNTSLFALANPKRQDSVILNCWEERREGAPSDSAPPPSDDAIPF